MAGKYKHWAIYLENTLKHKIYEFIDESPHYKHICVSLRSSNTSLLFYDQPASPPQAHVMGGPALSTMQPSMIPQPDDSWASDVQELRPMAWCWSVRSHSKHALSYRVLSLFPSSSRHPSSLTTRQKQAMELKDVWSKAARRSDRTGPRYWTWGILETRVKTTGCGGEQGTIAFSLVAKQWILNWRGTHGSAPLTL